MKSLALKKKEAEFYSSPWDNLSEENSTFTFQYCVDSIPPSVIMVIWSPLDIVMGLSKSSVHYNFTTTLLIVGTRAMVMIKQYIHLI